MSTLRTSNRSFVLACVAIVVVPAILPTLAYAQTVKAQTERQIERRNAQVAKAEQSIALATCKLNALKAGHTARQSVYFSFMAECLSQSVSTGQ